MKILMLFPKSLFLLIVAALILRFVVLMWSVPLNINGDQTRYEDWAQVTHIYGFAESYKSGHIKTFVNNQPPGSLYVITGAYELYIVAGKVIAKVTQAEPGSNHFVNTFLIHAMMRIPSILTDLGMGILVYFLVRKEMKEKRALLGASLILFNPVIFYNSSIWGQMDSINNFFFLLSLFFAHRKNYIFSVLSYALSLYTKFSLLPFLPFYAVFLYYHSGKNWKKIAVGVVTSFAAILLLTLPVSSDPIHWLITTVPVMASGELQNITVAAFNFWWMVTCGPIHCPESLPFATDTFLGISLSLWSFFLFGIVTLPLLYFQLRRSQLFITKKYSFMVFGIVAMSAFLFLPKMHDRYLYPFFPLFAVAAALSQRIKHYLILYCSLSVVHMGNVIYSYFPAFYPALIYYEILYSNLYRFSISALTVVLGVLIYINSFRDMLRFETQKTRGIPSAGKSSKKRSKKR